MHRLVGLQFFPNCLLFSLFQSKTNFQNCQQTDNKTSQFNTVESIQNSIRPLHSFIWTTISTILSLTQKSFYLFRILCINKNQTSSLLYIINFSFSYYNQNRQEKTKVSSIDSKQYESKEQQYERKQFQ